MAIAQLAEHLPSVHKALGSTPSTIGNAHSCACLEFQHSGGRGQSIEHCRFVIILGFTVGLRPAWDPMRSCLKTKEEGRTNLDCRLGKAQASPAGTLSWVDEFG